jgi:hypothetical protein
MSEKSVLGNLALKTYDDLFTTNAVCEENLSGDGRNHARNKKRRNKGHIYP